MILYIENPKDSTMKQLELTNEFSIVAGYKISNQKSITFLYVNNKLTERNILKNTIHNCFKKNKIPRNKSNQGCKGVILRKIIRH